MKPLVVVGDVLLDRDLDGTVERICPDAPVPVVDDPVTTLRPGGAGLAAALAAADGREVTLITALARDNGGDELVRLLGAAEVNVVDLGLVGPTPEKVRVRSDGRSLVRLDYGHRRGRVGAFTPVAATALAGVSGVLVADYGRGVAAARDVRAALAALPTRHPVVWDPHPRGPRPVAGVRLVTPNRREAAAAVPEVHGDDLRAVTERARALARSWDAAGVAVTLGPRGALLVDGAGSPFVVPATPAHGGDVCGAGDRFASTVAGLLADGALPSEAVAGAVAASSRFVAEGGAAAFNTSTPVAQPLPAGAGALQTAARVRAAGGTVVATGGCFDLLHAGHVSMLRAARALGDCLIVCLNSDDSVRRLKGPGRPLVAQWDRVSVLEAVDAVDAVALFDEDTPEALLEQLRPDVFAKGGDYRVADLAEAEVLARWGGQAVVLPYLEGRSTTILLEEVARRAHA